VAEDVYAALIRRAYQDFESGDLDLLRVVMATHVVWHDPGRSPVARDYKGPEAVLGFLGQLRERSGGIFRIEELDVLPVAERSSSARPQHAATSRKRGRLAAV